MGSAAAAWACLGQGWQPGIGDPGLSGWLTVAAYLACCGLAWAVAARRPRVAGRRFWMLLVPLLGAIACLKLEASAARMVALGATLIDFVLGVVLWTQFDIGGAQWQFVERHEIFSAFSYALGIDGIALVLILLSVFLMPICIGASWRSIEKLPPLAPRRTS